jgi:hypothetical protein
MVTAVRLDSIGRVNPHPSPEERFWAQCRKGGPDECWPWTGKLTDKGYGRFRVNGRSVYAHRFAYELLSGPIPTDPDDPERKLEIDHCCHNRDKSCPGNECVHRSCCNPDHLEPVIHAINCQRGRAAPLIGLRKLAKTHCPQGHPYAGENLFLDRNEYRLCRTCARANNLVQTARRSRLNATWRDRVPLRAVDEVEERRGPSR